MKWTPILVMLFTGAVLLYAAGDLPGWADPDSPASVHLSPHYIEHSVEEMHTPNMVTAVIADYRSFDTLFETAVILTAGLACALILNQGTKRDSKVR